MYSWIDLGEVINGVITDFELLIEQKQATIEYSDLPTIQAIPSQMSQLFSNLISNALKFSTPEINPIIDVTAKRIDQGEIDGHVSNPHGNYYNIQFKDNGIGFNQEHASRIFSIFQRLHGKTEYSGTGIGPCDVQENSSESSW